MSKNAWSIRINWIENTHSYKELAKKEPQFIHIIIELKVYCIFQFTGNFQIRDLVSNRQAATLLSENI